MLRLLFFLILFITGCGRDTSLKQVPAGICISFDDQAVAEWYEMRFLLNKYQAKVTFFVTRFPALEKDEVIKLHALQKDNHEIGSHGAMHVVSEYYIKEHSYKEYWQQEVLASISSMQEKGFKPTSFAYPYGAKYWFTDYMLSKYFKVVRGVAAINKEKDLTLINEIYYQPNGKRAVNSISFDTNTHLTEKMLEKAIKRAIRNQEILLLHGHLPSKKPNANNYNFDLRLLEKILELSHKYKLKFYRISDLPVN